MARSKEQKAANAAYMKEYRKTEDRQARIVYMRAWRRRNAEKLAERARQRYANNPEKVAEAQRKRRRRDPEKNRARVAVYAALASGRLVRGPCEHAGDDCLGRVEAHHDDYSEPLDVRWLCRRHHAELHAA